MLGDVAEGRDEFVFVHRVDVVEMRSESRPWPPASLPSAVRLAVQEERAKLLALLGRHAGLVAERHGVPVDRLRHDLLPRAGGCRRRGRGSRPSAARRSRRGSDGRMAHDAVLADDRQRLAVAHRHAGESRRRCAAPSARSRRRSATAATGSVQPIFSQRVAGIVAVEEVAHRRADDDDQRHDQPRAAG